MKREILLDMSRAQLEAAKDARRWAIYYRLNGNQNLADTWRAKAKCYLRCARLFNMDAHTEELETLHMRGDK